MRADTIARAQALLPATLAELAKGLGLTEDGPATRSSNY